jgi:SAM-dependent methyltransferase
MSFGSGLAVARGSPNNRLVRDALRRAPRATTGTFGISLAESRSMEPQKITNVQHSYDRVADEYVQRIVDELQHKPLDRQLLEQFAVRVHGLGPVCDLGCGPGHVARYLYERGVPVQGIDLSPAMIAHARQLNPGIAFTQGNMLALDVGDAVWGGIVAFYSLIHIPPADLSTVLRELKRVLRPGGVLLLAFHRGDDIIHLDEWWGHPVSLATYFFGGDDMQGYVQAAGLAIEEVIERPPYPQVEYPSHRVYMFAWKPQE